MHETLLDGLALSLIQGILEETPMDKEECTDNYLESLRGEEGIGG